MSSRIVAAFDDRDEARAAQMDLVEHGIRRDKVHLVESTGMSAPHNGWWERVKAFFTGAQSEDVDLYREASYRGSHILSAEVPDDRVDLATEVLERHHPVDLDQRASGWRATGWNATYSSRTGQATQAEETKPEMGLKAKGRTATDSESIPMVEEQMKVGKRTTRSGGVRIHSHVVEEPFSEQVNLRDEHVEVERHKVDRPVEASDRAFEERTYEASDMREEAVVEKEARVVEEVSLHTDVQQRTEEVRDTLRHTEVDIEHLGEDELHGIFDRDYGRRGYRFEDFRNAYAYGHDLNRDERFRGQTWEAVEPQARLGYEKKYPGTWDRSRDIIRHGYERRTKR